MENRQFQNLRDELRAAGCTLRCAAQYPDPADKGFGFETWWVTPPTGATKVIAVKLMGEDGYVLFLPVRGDNTIIGDVAALLGS